jgi:3-hydroxy-9,10-secoandrosta-1,3,5(10)-triene-9,17-dione monooxygenase reductase component
MTHGGTADVLTLAGPAPGAVSPARYRDALGRFCSGVTVVTAMDGPRPAGFTLQSFTALSLDPPLILVCPAETSRTWGAIERAGVFAVNVLATDQEHLARRFAASQADRFSGVRWAPHHATSAPHLEGALATIDCRLDSTQQVGDHHVAIGRVLDLTCNDGLPLLFYRGTYGIPAARTEQDPAADPATTAPET